jgi:hypothetical protein
MIVLDAAKQKGNTLSTGVPGYARMKKRYYFR